MPVCEGRLQALDLTVDRIGVGGGVFWIELYRQGAIELHDAIIQRETRIDQLAQSGWQFGVPPNVRRPAEGLQFDALALQCGFFG